MEILIPVHDQPHSDLAVRLGTRVARDIGGRVTLLGVAARPGKTAATNRLLERAVEIAAEAGVKPETILRVGAFSKEIFQTARRLGFDLLVLGERRRTLLARRVLSPPVKDALVRMPCSVLIARGRANPIRRLLVCEGGRDPSLLRRLIAGFTPLLKVVSELTVLHVMSQIAAGPGAPAWEQLEANAEELIKAHAPEGQFLEYDLETLRSLGVKPQAAVRHGAVVAEILEESRRGDYDLVVIGAHHYEGWEGILLADLAVRIVAQADRPVLVI